jgi:Cu2+-exporting ATPase
VSCCAPSAELAPDETAAHLAREEILLASRSLGGDLRQTDISVPTIHCGACMQAIEAALMRLPGVRRARVNLSAKRVSIQWEAPEPPPFLEALDAIGFEAHLFDLETGGEDATLALLVRALALAGFAASNIMLLSVSVWAGAGPETRSLFHWISALIALPALAYSGQVFFRSAWRALSRGTTNMDVPISIGVLLAFGMSLYETIHHGPHAYFDAAVSLLFFLLIGRTLDHMMRERARQAVKGLMRLSPRAALAVGADGAVSYLRVAEIEPGVVLLAAAGERIPVDAVVVEGVSDIDRSLVSGESVPMPASPGSALQAGTLNLTGPLRIRATAAAKDSFLAEMVRMMEAAEAGRSAYRRIADRAARLYAPVVHSTALLTLVAWGASTGDWHRAVTYAVAVLIITCPCALGLAVPMVQVVAARRLFEKGVMLKDGGALERLAEIGGVIFDKTGTLTCGEPRLIIGEDRDAAMLSLAASIAAHSRHPYSKALVSAGGGSPGAFTADRIAERPGFGLEAHRAGTLYRLGRPSWAIDRPIPLEAADAQVVLACDGRHLASFRFEDRLRTDARAAVAALIAEGMEIEIVSGDRDEPVRRLASTLGVAFSAGMSPREKVARIEWIAASGKRVLMVGDGLNDAPALAAAHVSMAPATAADVGRNAADLVFLRESLSAVPRAVAIARRAQKLVRQNLVLAVVYNLIAVPLAVAGLVTPLIAAVSMSLSSLVVIGNSMRLRSHGEARREVAGLAAAGSLALEGGR